MRCLNTKGKYGKITDTKIKQSIISKSVRIIISVEFIDQLFDYPIKCASLNFRTGELNRISSEREEFTPMWTKLFSYKPLFRREAKVIVKALPP